MAFSICCCAVLEQVVVGQALVTFSLVFAANLESTTHPTLNTQNTNLFDPVSFSCFRMNNSATTKTTKTSSCLTQGCHCFVKFCQTLVVDIMMDVGRYCGAARRRRERWLRSWLKHERETVRMVFAEAFHHSSAPFPPKFKGEWEGRLEKHDALRGQKTTRTRVATNCGTGRSFSCDEEDAVWSARPASLAEPRELQERRTVEQTADFAPMVQILDVYWAGCKTESCSKSWSRPSRTTWSRGSPCPRSPALPDLLLLLVFLPRRWWNSWWTCQCPPSMGAP